jgi:hypothetical protein
MNVTIHGYTSADIEDLEAFEPLPTDVWKVQADVTLSPQGGPPGEIFQFEIMSEAYLMAQLAQGAVSLGRVIVFREFRFAELDRVVSGRVNEIAAESDDWEAFALNLNHYMLWEFDNYKESVGSSWPSWLRLLRSKS